MQKQTKKEEDIDRQEIKSLIPKTKAPPPPPEKTASFFALFQFSTSKDKTLTFIASLFSTAQGFGLPFITVLFGDVANDFVPGSDPVDATFETTKMFIYLALAILVISFIASALWTITAAAQVKNLKLIYFKSLINKNCYWYDSQKIETLSNNFLSDVNSYEEIFSVKMHDLFNAFGMIFGGFLVGFIRGWVFTCFIICLTPILLFGLYFFFSMMMKGFKIKYLAYSEAGAITDEAFTFIKNVKSLCGEEHEIERYEKACEKAKKGTISLGWKSSFFYGLFMFSLFMMYGISFLVGSRLIAYKWTNHNVNRDYNVGDVLGIFFSVIVGVFAFGQVAPIAGSIQKGRTAVTNILKITKDKMLETSGDIKNDFKGEIEFKNVSFEYPSKPDKKILKNLNLKISPGQKIALVGPSGCGKSTIIQLLQRYYDPTEGEILLDGINLKEYDLHFLRSKFGLVAQQPILFADTIKNNILIGIENRENITKEKLDISLKRANAYDFVNKFENKENEYVGSLGGQISGGQKQRIALARILVRNPKLYLFDEATSALDRKNEIEIQNTLDSISEGQTSVTIAHRLTTVRNSDILFVIQDGQIIEKGNHDSLMKIKNGFYKELVENQISDVNQDFKKKINHKSSKNLLKQESLKDDLNVQTEIKSKKKLPSIWSFSGKEKYLVIPGLIFSLIAGSVMPLFGWILAKVLGELNKFLIIDNLIINLFFGYLEIL